MADTSEQVREFVKYFAKDAQKVQETSDSKLTARQTAIEELMGKLNKKTIRAGFANLKLKDSKGKEVPAFSDDGQEHEIDTYAATKKGMGIDSKDQASTQLAMDLYVAYKNEALKLKYADGTFMYDLKARPQEFIDDCITPLVRERIIPDNFIEDALSDTFQLINNTLNSNSAEIKRLKTEKQEKLAQLQTDFMGGRGKLDRAAAIGGKIDQLKKRVVNKLGKGNLNSIGIFAEGAGAVKDVGGAVLDVKQWIPKNGKIPKIQNAKFFLDPSSVLKMTDKEGATKFGVDGWKHLKENIPAINGEKGTTLSLDNSDGDDLRVYIEEAKQMKMARKIQDTLKDFPGMEEHAKTIGDLLAKPTNPTLRDAKFYTSESVDFLISNITNGIDIGKKGSDVHKLRAALEAANHDEVSRRIAVETIEDIDLAISNLIGEKHKEAGDAINGLYSQYVDSDEVEAVTAPKLDGVQLVDLFANGFSKSFSAASSELAPIGNKLADTFRKSLNGQPLKKDVQQDPKSAFAPFVTAATNAVKSVLDELLVKLSDKTIRDEVNRADVYPGNAEAQAIEDLKKSDEEIKQFEKDLVLIDEGGLSIAQQRSIEVLIAKIEKDRQVIALVKTIGGSLQSLGSGPTSIVGYAVDGVSDIVVGEVLGALKAAKLIMKLATDIKQALERSALLKKFTADLEHSKIAVSSLTSTIQGFVNNKKEQIKFRDLEIALTIVQIAGEIVGTVPTPITLAIGKTASKLAAASQSAADFIENTYNKKMLQRAWETTLAATNQRGNRKLGLQALRINPTLGMHAIAWAGMVKQPPDPVARMFMRSTGLDENTLAVSGTEEKVREYLATLLNEDRQLNDLDALEYDLGKLNVDWAPPLTPDFKCWALLTLRASRDASPKLLSGGEEKKVLESFKALDKPKPREEYTRSNNVEELENHLAAINQVCKALKDYNPRHLQGSHEEMENQAASMLVLVNKYKEQIEQRLKRVRSIRLAVKDITSCLDDDKLEQVVKEKFKLPPEELAEFNLSPVSLASSPIGIAVDLTEQYTCLKEEPEVDKLLTRVETALDEYRESVDKSEVMTDIDRLGDSMKQFLGQVTDAASLRRVGENEEAVKTLKINVNKLNEFCEFWVSLKKEVENNTDGTSNDLAGSIREKATGICEVKCASELIATTAFENIYA